MTKQTLSIELEAALIDRVRRYSEAHGTDVSETIKQLIGTLPVNGRSGIGHTSAPAGSGPGETEAWVRELTPGVRKLLGAGAGEADEDDYHRHLLEKYGR